jgi:hypothetical protein
MLSINSFKDSNIIQSNPFFSLLSFPSFLLYFLYSFLYLLEPFSINAFNKDKKDPFNKYSNKDFKKKIRAKTRRERSVSTL